MPIIHRRKGDWLDPKQCYVGAPPMAAHTGIPAQRIWSWLSQWQHGNMVAEYSGRPDKTINGNGDNDFYILLHAPAKTGSVATRNLGIFVKFWDISYIGAGFLDINWYAPHNAGAPQNLLTWTGYDWSGTDDTYGDAASGPAYFFYYDSSADPITYTPTANNDNCLLCRLTIDKGTVATLGAWHMPEETLPIDQLQVSAGNVGVGDVLKGFDTTLGSSIGALEQLIGDGTFTESLESLGRRTLFQTPWAVGSYHTNTGGFESYRQDVNGNPFLYRCKVRNLLGDASGQLACEPAFVLTADAGVQIKYISYEDDATTQTDTWTHTVGGVGVTNQLVTFSDADGGAARLDLDKATVTYVDVQVNATGADECTLQNVSLFEGPAWS